MIKRGAEVLDKYEGKDLPHIKIYSLNNIPFMKRPHRGKVVSQLIITSNHWKSAKGEVFQSAWAESYYSDKKLSEKFLKKQLGRQFLAHFEDGEKVSFKIFDSKFPKTKKELTHPKIGEFVIVNAKDILETTEIRKE